jgi:hypothetical protein
MSSVKKGREEDASLSFRLLFSRKHWMSNKQTKLRNKTKETDNYESDVIFFLRLENYHPENTELDNVRQKYKGQVFLTK